MKKRLVPLVLVRSRYKFYPSLYSNISISGFYSLFSVTEEPFVSSGGKFGVKHWVDVCSSLLADQWMGFYWKDKKDQVGAISCHLDEH